MEEEEKLEEEEKEEEEEEEEEEEAPNLKKKSLPSIGKKAKALLSGLKDAKTKAKSKQAIEDEQEDYSLQLTPLGQTMAHFPLDPFLARAIITSPEQGCVHEVLSVVAMLSVDSVVFTPHNRRELVAAAHRKFVSRDGDHVTLLNMFRAYKSVRGNKVGGKGVLTNGHMTEGLVIKPSWRHIVEF